MRTAGQVLKEGRLRKNLSLEEIEKQTKIRFRFLKLIEEDAYAKFSNAVTAKGFIRNYALFLELNPDSVLAIFRRDFSENERGQIVPRGMIIPLNQFAFSWNPKLTGLVVGLVFLTIFFGYLIRQFSSWISAPEIEVAYPPENIVLEKLEVDLIGKTDRDASFFVDGEIVSLNENGEFSKRLNLERGENEIVLEAVSRRGKKTRIIRKIFVGDF